jgi:hypothetical protein
LKDP